MCSALQLSPPAVAGTRYPAIKLELLSTRVILADDTTPARAAMESFVAREFLQHYSARVELFMPYLLGLCHSELLVGVAGLRPAASQTLFIEHYLDNSVQDTIRHYTGLPTQRDGIIEIGNLAGHYPGVTRALFPLLTELVLGAGYQWVVCNATHSVQNALTRLAIPFLPMLKARAERLGPARFAWGSYYNSESHVIAISPAMAHEALQQQPGLASACTRALAQQSVLLPSAA